jgi:hypothetical protein
MRKVLVAVLTTLLGMATAVCTQAHGITGDICRRPAVGSVVGEPEDLRSENGVLQANLTLRNDTDATGMPRYCYVAADGSQSPTLRVRPLPRTSEVCESSGTIQFLAVP